MDYRNILGVLRGWLVRHGASIILIVVGLMFVAMGVWVVAERQAIATALVLLGAGMVIIGTLLPRIEGVVTLSLQEGLKFTLAAGRAAARKAAEHELSPEETEQAVGTAIEEAVSQSIRRLKVPRLSHGINAIIAPTTAEAIADAAVERIVDLDAAREQRRRAGHDVENESRFADVQRKLESGEPLTSEEQAAINKLVEAVNRFLEAAKKPWTPGT